MNEEDISQSFLEQGAQLLGQMAHGQTLGPMMGVSVPAQEALYALAYTAYTQARYAEAMQAFSFLMTADHFDRRYFSGYAACLRAQKRHGEALKHYGVASMLDLTDPEPVMRMAECHLALGERVQARTALDYALVQARAHEAHRSYAPRLEAMLAFLDNDAATNTSTTDAATAAP